jgi:hypothetical protein
VNRGFFALEQALDEETPDEAGRAGHEIGHGLLPELLSARSSTMGQALPRIGRMIHSDLFRAAAKSTPEE